MATGMKRGVDRGGSGTVLCALMLLLGCSSAMAEKLVMPKGMGGVPDIGAIPCSVFNEMSVVAPLGTRHSLLTWSAGYLQALTGRSLQQLSDTAGPADQPWTYDRLAAELAAYCEANPQAVTRDAAAALARALGVAPSPQSPSLKAAVP